MRHRRYGDSPFVVEPNIKEGRGGLRDLQTLYWMARYVFDTAAWTNWPTWHGPGGGILTATEAQAAPPLAGISCGPCGSICTTSPAAPRSA